jgi:hypothetical protein
MESVSGQRDGGGVEKGESKRFVVEGRLCGSFIDFRVDSASLALVTPCEAAGQSAQAETINRARRCEGGGLYRQMNVKNQEP